MNQTQILRLIIISAADIENSATTKNIILEKSETYNLNSMSTQKRK